MFFELEQQWTRIKMLDGNLQAHRGSAGGQEEIQKVYLSRSNAETCFLSWNNNGLGIKMLDGDHQAHILPFLFEVGREQYLTQLNRMNCLLEYIGEQDATLLGALINPALQASQSTDQIISIEIFLKDYANRKPIIQSIKCMLMEPYSDPD
jgi:hypothetical protein